MDNDQRLSASVRAYVFDISQRRGRFLRAPRPKSEHWSLNAELVVTPVFTQMERVEEMRAQEKLHPDVIITGDGHKSIAVLNDIAAEILKWELGNKIMRSTAAIIAPPRAQDLPPASLASRVAKLDPVDRNLV